MKKISAILMLFVSCVETQKVVTNDYINQRWSGKTLMELYTKLGAPSKVQDLQLGMKAYIYEWGNKNTGGNVIISQQQSVTVNSPNYSDPYGANLTLPGYGMTPAQADMYSQMNTNTYCRAEYLVDSTNHVRSVHLINFPMYMKIPVPNNN